MMMRMLPRRRFAMLVVAALLLTALGSARLEAQHETSRPQVGDMAEDFELPSLDGATVKLSKLVEQGPVVLVVLRGFPGYQCPVCTAQVGQLLARAEQFEAEKARVVLVYPGPAE